MKKDDTKEQAESKYPKGWDDECVKAALLLIGQNNSDKNQNDNKNQLINDILKEASRIEDPTKPQYIGAKRLKQAKNKTVERIQPLSWTLQGDGATEEDEIIVTKALKEVLHRAKYDVTFTGKSGIIDKIISYGNGYRLIKIVKNDKTNVPIEFEIVDSNNLWMSVKATSFRNGNKNVTQLVAIFRGTVREFEEKFPEYEGVPSGLIPRDFKYKDLDQTASQKYQQTFMEGTESGDDDNEEMEWAYYFDIYEKTFIFFAGADLSILEKKEDEEYPFTFDNLEGKKECYIPVSNWICIPSEEGIYDIGIIALCYDLGIMFRQTMNWDFGRGEENAYPDTLINIPEGQADSFFALKEIAGQMRARGETAYIPLTFNPNNPGQVSSSAPILNGGDPNVGEALRATIDDEFRKNGVYLDEPLSSSLTEFQIDQMNSNASTLPRSIMKYNAPETEFEVMVAIDILKKNIKKNDKTPLILDTSIELPDGQYSTRGLPFTLGWLKEKLDERAWRCQADPNSGAKDNDMMMIRTYRDMMKNMDPASPEVAAMNEKVALLTGIKIKQQNPASAVLTAQNATQPQGQTPPMPQTPALGQPMPQLQ